ncbi:Universal stress protein family protein [compost metagenome]
MKTIIVPLDFSHASVNAAEYASQMAGHMRADKIVLYHTYGGSYQILDAGTEIIRSEINSQLQHLSDALIPLAGNEVKFELVAGDGFLIDEVLELVDKYNADLIVMGITGKNAIEHKLIGSNTLRVASDSTCPVLIVPSEARFKEVKKVALSMKFKAGILDETPYDHIRNMVRDLNAELVILNVADENHRVNVQNIQSGLTATHLMFDDMNAHIEFLGEDRVVERVTDYVQEHGIQMLISITHKLGFLESLFKGSVTKQLAFHTHVPLMVFKAIQPEE